ncbi:CrcB family protein [uncultured Schumannella sp.]|uniref:fluoride efflux transporter FluC n=1 Tax=uncultured Schumannella sp. TaxID=1195956 RepID=UPI0025F22FF7|nr:CrcB family protein [uncultured Schumannella sp.]
MSTWVIAAALGAGALGALARYGVTVLLSHPRARIPWAVLTVNVVGSALGGVLLALAVTGQIDPELRFVLFGGFAGGLTTFSTLSVETLQLASRRRVRAAIVSLAGNLVLGLASAGAGFALTLAVLA